MTRETVRFDRRSNGDFLFPGRKPLHGLDRQGAKLTFRHPNHERDSLDDSNPFVGQASDRALKLVRLGQRQAEVVFDLHRAPT